MQQVDTTIVYKSLGDATRLSVVRRLAQSTCELNGSDIVMSCAEVLKLSQPTMSHHFNRLVHAGVLLERKKGTEKFYHLNLPLLEQCGIDAKKI